STINNTTPVAYQERILLFLAWDNITKGNACTGNGINIAMDMNVHVNCRNSQRFGFFVANPMLQFSYFSLKNLFIHLYMSSIVFINSLRSFFNRDETNMN